MKKSVLKSILLLSSIGITFCFLLLLGIHTQQQITSLKNEIERDLSSIDDMNSSIENFKKNKVVYANLRVQEISLDREMETLSKTFKTLNDNLETLNKNESDLIARKEETSQLDFSVKVPYIYYDHLCDDELINVVLKHFESIKLKNKEAYIETVSTENVDYLLNFFNAPSQYIEKIEYYGDPLDATRVLPDSFFLKVKTTRFEYFYNIGVNKYEGRWLIHDYD